MGSMSSGSAKERRLAWVQRICRAIEAGPESRPALATLARRAGVGPHHLLRSFKRIVGVTPRQYADQVRLLRLKERLRGGDKVTDALYEAGYGSSSRLYERAPARLGMTPATYRRGGKGARIAYTIVPGPLGRLLVAATGRGMCAVGVESSDAHLLEFVRREYPEAEIRRDDRALRPLVRRVLPILAGRPADGDLPIDIRATRRSRRPRRPAGATRSYRGVASHRQQRRRAPSAGLRRSPSGPSSRAPSVREDSTLGGYGWGSKGSGPLLEREKE
jgi:AraC family transcriptional regulator of adaptative response/methylated-DNA-[protein]-cysteine methyltransferase